MPQYQEPPCPGAQVLDLDTALMDGILGGAVAGGPVDVLAEKMDLPAVMAELESAAAAVVQHEEIPAVFICPISLDPMAEPVTLCTGRTYERGNIARWLAMGRRTCPTTMQELWDDALTPNARYRDAEVKMTGIMQEEKARAHIGDTGLLDHLLKHMAGKIGLEECHGQHRHRRNLRRRGRRDVAALRSIFSWHRHLDVRIPVKDFIL